MPDKGIKDAIDLPILQIHCILQKSLNIDSKKKSLQGCCLQPLVASDVFVADADVRKMAGLCPVVAVGEGGVLSKLLATWLDVAAVRPGPRGLRRTGGGCGRAQGGEAAAASRFQGLQDTGVGERHCLVAHRKIQSLMPRIKSHSVKCKSNTN
jgi:hypothetical protein